MANERSGSRTGIRLWPERHANLLQTIKAYCNQGVRDASRYMQEKLADIEGDV